MARNGSKIPAYERLGTCGSSCIVACGGTGAFRCLDAVSPNLQDRDLDVGRGAFRICDDCCSGRCHYPSQGSFFNNGAGASNTSVVSAYIHFTNCCHN